MYFRVLLDGTQVTEPIGLDRIQITLERDKIVKGLIRKYTNKFTFIGDGYEYLREVRNEGICNQVDVLIEYHINLTQPWRTLFAGVINISDTKFTLPYGKAEAAVEDNAWTSYISNNKSIKAHIDVAKSKNETVITAVTPLNVKFFYSLTGSGGSRDVYLVDDCFRFLVAFMTDGLVGYTSPCFGSGGELEHIGITTGGLISGTTLASMGSPYFSFAELFQEIDKRWNISFRIDNTGSTPVIVIDRTDAIFSESTSITFDDPIEVVETYDKEELFSVIRFGSQTTLPYDGADSNFPDNQFLGWKEEEYHVLGQCNIDRELSLKGGWIVDHNIIHQAYKNAVTDYDDELFIIQLDSANDAMMFDTFNPGAPPYYYNLGINNASVAQNYLGGIPNSIAEFVGLNTNSALAGLTTDMTLVPASDIFIWDDDSTGGNYDPGNNYNTGNGRYTAPATGTFSVSTQWFLRSFSYLLDIHSLTDGDPVGEFFLRRYDSGGTLLESISMGGIYKRSNDIGAYLSLSPDAPDIGFQWGITLFMNATEYVRMEAELDALYLNSITVATLLTPGEESYFRVDAADDEGGVWQEYDPSDYAVVNYGFDYPITFAQMLIILGAETERVNFSLNGLTYGGWIKKATFNIQLAMANFILTEKNRSA